MRSTAVHAPQEWNQDAIRAAFEALAMAEALAEFEYDADDDDERWR